MKHQHFGDEIDYRKYSLIRALTAAGDVSVGVCWMFTDTDGRNDGRFTSYLDQPKHRRCDPPLYDAVAEAMASGSRYLDHVSRLILLPGARFHSALVPDKRVPRGEFFRSVMATLTGVALLFFDPDNGLEVPSKPLGRRDSSKFLLWSELEAAYSSGHSVLVYQHFPREPRPAFIARMKQELHIRTGANEVVAFSTSRVLYLLSAQDRHVSALRVGAEAVARAWASQIEIQ